MKKRIAVDFDGTLCSVNYPYIGKQKWPHKLILWYCKYQQKKGNIIILNTLRTKEKHLSIALDWLKSLDFIPDFVNENDPILVSIYGESRKIGADIYIDDRNFGFLGWFLRKF